MSHERASSKVRAVVPVNRSNRRNAVGYDGAGASRHRPWPFVVGLRGFEPPTS